MNNNCNIIKDLLTVYAIGECSEDTSALVKEHLNHCEGCRAQLDAFSSVPEITPIDEKKSFSDFSRKIKIRSLKKTIITTVIALAVLFGIGAICWIPESAVSYEKALPEANEAIDGGFDIFFACPNYKEAYVNFVRSDDGSTDVYITVSKTLFTSIIPDADRSDNFLRITDNICVSYKNNGRVLCFVPDDSEIKHIYYVESSPADFMVMDSNQLESLEHRVLIWE